MTTDERLALMTEDERLAMEWVRAGLIDAQAEHEHVWRAHGLKWSRQLHAVNEQLGRFMALSLVLCGVRLWSSDIVNRRWA